MKLCPLNPLAMRDRRMDDGPMSGMTLIFLVCAIATTSEPGSAMAGQPASEMMPMFSPLDIGMR